MSIQVGFGPGDFSAKVFRQAAAEFIAVLLFVFLGAGAVVVALNLVSGPDQAMSFITAIALTHGLAIAVLVAATANISGGHVNPAVTFAMVLSGKQKLSTGVLYVIAQLAGAVIGALLLKAVLAGPSELGHLGSHVINNSALEDQVGGSAFAALIVEAVLTFVLVFVVFATAIDPKGPQHLAPMAIGLAILIDHFVGIPLTGASMNPARSFGPALVANYWTDLWVYFVGPVIGGGAAALVYEYVFLNREE
jgi:aquaporin TIP